MPVPRRRLAVLVVGVALSGAVSAVAAPARADGPCTIWFSGASGGVWSDARNWSTTADGSTVSSRAPGSTDDVCVATTKTWTTSTVLQGSTTVHSITWGDGFSRPSPPRLVVRDRVTLTLGGASSFIFGLQIGRARIDGPGTLRLSQATATGSTFAVGSLEDTDNLRLEGVRLIGTDVVSTTVSNRMTVTGDLRFSEGATLTVKRQLYVRPDPATGGSVWSGNGRLDIRDDRAGADGYAIVQMATGGTWQMGVALVNSGRFQVETGRAVVTRSVDLRQGTLGNTGSWLTFDGADLDFGGAIRAIDASVSISAPSLIANTANLASVTGSVRAGPGWTTRSSVVVGATGSLTVVGSTLPRVQVAAGGTFRARGGATVVGGVDVAEGGVLEADRIPFHADVTNAGVLRWSVLDSDGGPRQVQIDGDYTAAAAATTSLEALVVTGVARLAGTYLYPGRATDGEYDVIRAGSLTGVFSVVKAAERSGRITPHYTPTGFGITVG